MFFGYVSNRSIHFGPLACSQEIVVVTDVEKLNDYNQIKELDGVLGIGSTRRKTGDLKICT